MIIAQECYIIFTISYILDSYFVQTLSKCASHPLDNRLQTIAIVHSNHLRGNSHVSVQGFIWWFIFLNDKWKEEVKYMEFKLHAGQEGPLSGLF